MERSKLASGVIGFFIFLVLVVSILTMSLCLGIRRNVKAAIFGTQGSDVAVMAGLEGGGTQAGNEEEPQVLYSAILTDGEIYVYDAYGAVYDTVKSYAEFLTEGDKALLSDGLDFYSEEELESFMNDFEE